MRHEGGVAIWWAGMSGASADAVFALVELRGLTGEGFEVLVKAGEVVEAAFVAELFNADAVIEEQLTGVADADLGEELGVSLAGPGFEIAAKGIGHQAGDGGHLFQVDLPGKVAEGVVIDGVDAVILSFGEIGPEADRG